MGILKMSKKYKLAVLVLILVAAIATAVSYLHGRDIAVLNPKGSIGHSEQRLIITATLLMLIVVIPVFILTFFIAWRYREGNKNATYMPDWDHDFKLEFTWWALPGLIILILSVITWRSSHQLDPFRPIASSKPPITIQVVALQWKWLFIYPAQNIATVNYVQFPAATPINFEITSDAPMNSFWIPSLGGQVYAMAGMRTSMHLMADGTGSYDGVSANLSGRGFAGMKFLATSSTSDEFSSWVASVRHEPKVLNQDTYDQLSKPTENNPVSYYSSQDANLYDNIINKFMMPADIQQSMPVSAAHYGGML